MKKLLLASAVALATLASPAIARDKHNNGNRGAQTHQQHDRQQHNNHRSGTKVVLGIGLGTPTYGYNGYTNYQYGPYPYSETYGANRPYGYNGYTNYRSACGFNDTPVFVTGLRNTRGSLYVTSGQINGRLYGERFRPASTICVDRQTAVTGYVSFVHDVNNNGYYDRRDGVGQARITPNYDYRGGFYGARQPAQVNIRYGYRF